MPAINGYHVIFYSLTPIMLAPFCFTGFSSSLGSLPSLQICLEQERLQQPRGLQQQLLYPAAPPRSMRSQTICVCVYPSELDEETIITPHLLSVGKCGNKWTLWHNPVSPCNSCWVVQLRFSLKYGERSDKRNNQRAIEGERRLLSY